jgi:hypothetical protein
MLAGLGRLSEHRIVEALSDLKKATEMGDVSSILAEVIPSNICAHWKGETFECSSREVSHIIYWLRNIAWEDALGPKNLSPTCNKKSCLSLHKNRNLDPKISQLCLFVVYLLGSEHRNTENSERCWDYIVQLVDWLTHADSWDIGYINNRYLHQKENTDNRMTIFLHHVETIFNKSRVMASGDSRIAKNDHFTVHGLLPANCGKVSSVISLIALGGITVFLPRFCDLLVELLVDGTDSLNDNLLETMHQKLIGLFEAHIKEHSDLKYYKQYVEAGYNIKRDGLCGYRALAAIVLRELRIRDIIKGKGGNYTLTDQEYVSIKHETLEHDSLCDDMEGLYEKLLKGMENVRKLIEKVGERDDLCDVFNRMKNAFDYINKLLNNRKEHKYFSNRDGWCTVETLPLMSICLFQNDVPMMVYAKDLKIKTHMQLVGSTLPMQQANPCYDNPCNDLPRRYRSLYEMLHSLNSNAIVYGNSNHFFIADNVDSPMQETM